MIKLYFTFKNGQVKKCFQDNKDRKYIAKRESKYTKQESWSMCLNII
jgi:hypothetical protein